MAKYIDRGALIEWLKHIRLIDLSDGLGLCRVIMEDDFKKAIKKMPKGIIADVAPVRHGKWEIVVGSNGKEYMVCTCCRVSQDLTGVFTYCQNCGCRSHSRRKENDYG